eukprot:100059_1
MMETCLIVSVLIYSIVSLHAFDGFGTVIGIDLGTSYSSVGVFVNGKVEIIPNSEGNQITPSYVAFTDTQRLIGEAAKRQFGSNPSNTVYDIKRIIGRKFHNKIVQKNMERWPFEIINVNDCPYIKVSYHGETHLFAPEQIEAMLLVKMKQIAEKYLDKSLEYVVLTVPSYFDISQRNAINDAAKIAGLTILRILSDSVAGSIPFAFDKIIQDKNIIVYDLGGSTLDVSLLTVDEGVIEVVSTSSDLCLGGQYFIERVMDHFIKVFMEKHEIDISANKTMIAKLQIKVEKAQRMLSSSKKVHIKMTDIVKGIDFEETLTRLQFEQLNDDLFRQTLKPLECVLMDSWGMKKSDIHEIVLVGGSTRIPKIHKLIRDLFNGKEPKYVIDPDIAVAFGAAVQGAIIGGADSENIQSIILDAMTFSLGIETPGGVMTKLIQKGDTLPIREQQVFFTHRDDQPSFPIRVYMGERAMVEHNIFLGEFELSGIQRAKRGVAQIRVSIEVDHFNLCIIVSAKDMTTKSTDSIKFGLCEENSSQGNIEEMIRISKQFEEEDMRQARNKLEAFACNLKNELSVNTQIEGECAKYKVILLDAVNGMMEWIDNNDDADIDDLNEKQEEFYYDNDEILNLFYVECTKKNVYQDDESFEVNHIAMEPTNDPFIEKIMKIDTITISSNGQNVDATNKQNNPTVDTNEINNDHKTEFIENKDTKSYEIGGGSVDHINDNFNSFILIPIIMFRIRTEQNDIQVAEEVVEEKNFVNEVDVDHEEEKVEVQHNDDIVGEGFNAYIIITNLLRICDDMEWKKYLRNFVKHKLNDERLKFLADDYQQVWQELIPEIGIRLQFQALWREKQHATQYI